MADRKQKAYAEARGRRPLGGRALSVWPRPIRTPGARTPILPFVNNSGFVRVRAK